MPRRIEPDDDQLTLVLTRDERLELARRLRQVQAPGMSPAMARNLGALLEAIELSSGANGCRISREVLAAKIGVDPRTLRRWLPFAAAHGVAQVIPEKNETNGWQSVNWYVPNWDRVRWLVRTCQAGAAIGDSHLEHDRDQPDGDSQFEHVEAAQSAGASAGPEARLQADLCPPRGDRMPPRGGQFVPPPLEDQLAQRVKRKPFSASESLNPIRTFHHSERCKDVPPGERGDGLSPGGDTFPLSEDVLRDPKALDAWFRFAVSKGWIHPIHRLRVFTVARSVVRRKVGVGAFVRLVKRRRWDCAGQADEDWARLQIETLDRRASYESH